MDDIILDSPDVRQEPRVGAWQLAPMGNTDMGIGPLQSPAGSMSGRPHTPSHEPDLLGFVHPAVSTQPSRKGRLMRGLGTCFSPVLYRRWLELLGGDVKNPLALFMG
jgi:hypothetical protein